MHKNQQLHTKDLNSLESTQRGGPNAIQFVDNRPDSSNVDFDSGKSFTQKDPLQRVIIGGDTKIAMGRTLGGVLRGLNDIDLVEGDHGINLHICFDKLPEGTMGLTSVWVKGSRINPHTDISPEEAAKNGYTILIQLNVREFREGKSPSLFGSLFETVSHEWELHGRQHALNIAEARRGGDTLTRIDHVTHFSRKPSGLDGVIAEKILAEKDPRIQQQIFDAYMRDVFAHIYHLQTDFLIPNKDSRTIVPVEMLFRYLRTVVQSISTYKKILDPSIPFDKNLLKIDKYATSHGRDLIPPKAYQGPNNLLIYPRAKMWIKLLNTVFQTPPLKDSLMDAALSMMRKDVKDALYHLHQLEDYRAIPEAARIHMDQEDDKEEWKRAVLIPRMRALAAAGVDVETLNSKLSLREKGAKKEEHHGAVKPRVIRLDPKKMTPIPTPVLKIPATRSAFWKKIASQQQRSEDPLMASFHKGDLGIYHIGSIEKDFEPAIVKRILAGEHGPFKDDRGHQITFVTRKSEDTFYFDSPFLHQ